MNSEYIEEPKLTQKEKQFCRLIKTGYLIRQKNNTLYWVVSKVEKYENKEWSTFIDSWRINMKKIFPHLKFDFIKWEDKEPWAVEDLLKLEVEE